MDHWYYYPILVVVGFVVGFINTVAGGGMVVLCYSALTPWATLLLDVYMCMHVYDDYAYNNIIIEYIMIT